MKFCKYCNEYRPLSAFSTRKNRCDACAVKRKLKEQVVKAPSSEYPYRKKVEANPALVRKRQRREYLRDMQRIEKEFNYG